ncbi:MAG: DNRLRE domain-containing protein [Planctomycetes bacterium]|nr:DNRLRE domain-containing protein [Planctomycetota bacterium]
MMAVALLCAAGAYAAPNDWAEGTPGKDNGASRDCYNRAGQLEWQNKMGDWRDARDVAQGDEPYAAAPVGPEHKGKTAEWDVTRLVQEWVAGKYANQGMFLRAVGGQGACTFGSREQEDAARRPQLVLTGDGPALTLTPQADTFLDRSTYRSLGNSDSLRVSGSNHALLRFDLSGTGKVGKVQRATLRLHNLAQAGGTPLQVGVFRCCQGHDAPETAPLLGLAARYPSDRGIAKDPDVVFFADFEAENWAEGWSQAAPQDAIQIAGADPERKFQPLLGNALRAQLAKGKSTALNMLYKFRQHAGGEPEEIYFRYYLRLGDDWNQTADGGKMPGISGTYGVAGWGGRRADGTNGWSARGAFALSIPADNPLAGRHPIGTYCYHADQPGSYGDIWLWKTGYRGFLEKNRWYSVEQHLKLNTPGEKDGVLRAWVDGRPAFQKTDLRFRHVGRLKIEQIWMNVYHGGTTPSPYDQHLFIDNVVIAKKYIGPMKTTAAP